MKERDHQKRPVSRARALLSSQNREGDGVETGETSFRVYYGEKGAAVPFMWESQPGTPKHPSHSNDYIVPPLTPPPSFNNNSSSSSSSSSRKSRKSWIIFSTFFSSLSRIKSSSHMNPSPGLSFSSYNSGTLSWSSSSSSSSPISSPYPDDRVRGKKHRSHRRSLSFSGSIANKFPLFDDDEQEEVMGGSRANSRKMCFGYNKQGCYSMKNVKNAILSIKGN